MIWILLQDGEPVCGFSSEYEAKCAIWQLPPRFDSSLCLVALPVDQKLFHQEDAVFTVAEGGGRRFSGGPAPAPVTLSSNGNKIT